MCPLMQQIISLLRVENTMHIYTFISSHVYEKANRQMKAEYIVCIRVVKESNILLRSNFLALLILRLLILKRAISLNPASCFYGVIR